MLTLISVCISDSLQFRGRAPTAIQIFPSVKSIFGSCYDWSGGCMVTREQPATGDHQTATETARPAAASIIEAWSTKSGRGMMDLR